MPTTEVWSVSLFTQSTFIPVNSISKGLMTDLNWWRKAPDGYRPAKGSQDMLNGHVIHFRMQ